MAFLLVLVLRCNRRSRTASPNSFDGDFTDRDCRHGTAARVAGRRSNLAEGGNAADAIIAANAMMGLVSPMMCGVGGDMFCLFYDAATKKFMD